MLKRFSLRTVGFSLAVQVAQFDTLKAPLLSKVQVAEMALKFYDWAKASRDWRHKLMRANEAEALEGFSVTGYHLANDYFRARGKSTWRSLVCG